MKNLFDVSGKVAVVTGGSSGIGAMMARGLLENGAKVYITARKEERLQAMQQELSQYGECVAIAADMSKVEGIEAFVAAVSEQENHLDILINNAGANWAAPVDQFPEAGWDKVMDLNVKSIFFLTQALAPKLRAAASADRPAKVINIASVDGQMVNPQETYSYNASKAALIHLTKRLSLRLIEDHICVTAIAPGAFASDMNVSARDHAEAIAARIPARRIGRGEDMAGAAIYLASRAGDYVVGQTVTVDGGISLVHASASMEDD